ncbi:MAG: DUF1566 domain-containing protein, partial [Proteobacteria bacterium]|nr:DUF1566 domain-containing protein [Pseudomonadota bacterium]
FSSGDWNSDQTVTVTGANDSVKDGDQPYSIVLAATSSGDPNYDGADPADVSVTNIDDDWDGFVVSTISGNTAEDGSSATFTVRLNTEPISDVIIGLSSSDTGEGTVLPTIITFGTGNWSVDQTATVTGIGDSVDDGEQAYSIVLGAASSGDPNYGGLDPDDVPLINIDDDAAGYTISSVSGNTAEDGSFATFTVRLTSEPTSDVVIGLSSSDTGEGTVAPPSLTFSAGDWADDQTVTVTGVGDYVDDGDQTYNIVLAAAVSDDPNYGGTNPADVTATNTDDDFAGFTVSSISNNTAEDETTATFTVRLTSEPTADVTIAVSSSNTDEGTVSPPNLTFSAGSWSFDQTVTVTGVDDSIIDGDKSYTIVLAAAVSSDPNYDGADPADVSATNTDNSTADFVVSAISNDTTEGETTATFTIRLTSEPTANVSIGISSSNTDEGTVSPPSLTFSAGDWTDDKTVTVTGVDDAVDDGNKTFSIVLAAAVSSDPNYNGQNPIDVTVTNIDDDTAEFTIIGVANDTDEGGTPATFTVRLNSEPTADVDIGVSSGDTGEGTVAPASLSFTSADWSTPKTVTVTGEDDDVDDGNQTFSIVLAAAVSSDLVYDGLEPSSVTVTNIDDDTAGFTVIGVANDTDEGGTPATFTVRLNSEPTADVDIGVSSLDTSEGTVAPGSLSFTSADWSTPQTVTVTGVDDTIDDGNQTYTIDLAAAVSSDLGYDGQAPSDVSVINLDDDTAGYTVGAITNDTDEGGTPATFTVRLNSEPTADVDIGVSSDNLNEGTVSSQTLTFNNTDWSSDQTITVTGQNDAVDDGNQVYTIELTASSSDLVYNVLDPSDVAVTNVDDDTFGFTVDTITNDTAEDGTDATFTVRLNSEPTSDVTIGVSSSNTDEGTVFPASLVFTWEDWFTDQTVTVTGVDDAVVDGDIGYTILLAAATSADLVYAGQDPPDVSVTNINDDAYGFVVGTISGDTAEDGTQATFTVRLSAPPAASVTIDVTSDDVSEGTAGPTSLTFTTGDWDADQTVTVTGVDDADADRDRAYSIVLAAATSTDLNFDGLDPDDVSVINLDDEEQFLPDTGQTTTYDGNFGEDHDYDIFPPSYTDNGDGTVTDNNTLLTWQQEDDNTLKSFDDATTDCANLNLGVYDDWRLPFIKELESIVHWDQYEPAINSVIFPNTNIAKYWSASVDQTYLPDTNTMKYVNFDVGQVYADYNNVLNNQHYSRCVRGGGDSDLWTLDFVDNGDGTITHQSTGLMWAQVDDSTTNWNWWGAFFACEDSTLAGYTDWRLPNVREYLTIVSDTLFDPPFDSIFSTNATGSHWTSTTNKRSKDMGYDVGWMLAVNSCGNFYTGYKDTYPAGARCVRGLTTDVQTKTTTQQAYVKAANDSSFDGDDSAKRQVIAISGDTLVVGVQNEDACGSSIINGTTATANDSCGESGAVYVYKRTGTDWAQEAYIKAANANPSDNFGASVDIDGDTIVVGAPGEDSSDITITNGTTASADQSSVNSGAVYVYKRTDTTWAQEAYIKAANNDSEDRFGHSVAINVDTIVASSVIEGSNETTITNGTTASADNSNASSGAVYVYFRTGTDWAQEAYIKADNSEAGDEFGHALDISGPEMVVGVPNEDSNQTTITNDTTTSSDNSSGQSGAVYIYRRTGTDWAQTAYIKAPNNDPDDLFGTSVAFVSKSGMRRLLAVGAPGEDSNQTTITNTNSASSDDSSSNSGAVYLFDRNNSGTTMQTTYGTWVQGGYLKAPNNGSIDQFGIAVAGGVHKVVVGAIGEDSGQSTITNGNDASTDNSVSGSGAAYVFHRIGTTWYQETYIKATNVDSSDNFGYNVAMSDETVVVGAPRESSNETSISNGTTASANNDSMWSGAVYVYIRE